MDIWLPTNDQVAKAMMDNLGSELVVNREGETVRKELLPLADKLIVMAARIMLIPHGRIPAWAVFLVLAREIIVTGLRSIASSEGIVIDASDLGKYKTIYQMVAIPGLLLHYDYYWFFGLRVEWLHVNMHNFGMFFFVIALALTLWSGADYLVKFFRVLTR